MTKTPPRNRPTGQPAKAPPTRKKVSYTTPYSGGVSVANMPSTKKNAGNPGRKGVGQRVSTHKTTKAIKPSKPTARKK